MRLSMVSAALRRPAALALAGTVLMLGAIEDEDRGCGSNLSGANAPSPPPTTQTYQQGLPHPYTQNESVVPQQQGG